MMETGASPAAEVGVEWYEIRLKGLVDERWAGHFAGMDIAHERAATTRLAGPLADQAALYGVLNRLRDLGFALVSVRCIDEDECDRPEQKESQ
jgi:hypothetical protein